jgi:hypothetical protein
MIQLFKTGDRVADSSLVPWFTKDDFTKIVMENIQTKSLQYHNTAAPTQFTHDPPAPSIPAHPAESPLGRILP